MNEHKRLEFAPVGSIEVVSMSALSARRFVRDMLGVAETAITRVESRGKPDDAEKYHPAAILFRVHVRDLRRIK